MAREKELYRENLQRLDALFPGQELLPVRAAATYLGLDVRTVLKIKDIPKKKAGRCWLVPKTGLASWLS